MSRETVEERLASVETKLNSLDGAVHSLTAAVTEMARTVTTLTERLADKAKDGAVHAATCDLDRNDLRQDVAALASDVKANTRARWIIGGGATAAGGAIGWLAKVLSGGG